MNVQFILTVFSVKMLGERASLHVRSLTHNEAQDLIHAHTQIVANRPTHERLARNLFPLASPVLGRYVAMNKPGTSAILIGYNGPPLDDDGHVPTGGVVTYHLLEVDAYQEIL